MGKVIGNKTVTASVAIGLAAMLWGVDGVLLTPQLGNLNAAFVVFIIHLVPLAIMSIVFPKEYKLLKTITPKDFFYLFLVSFFGAVLGTLSIVKALFLMNFNSLSVVVLLQKLQPVFAILLAFFILKEKIHKHFILWASIALVSGYFLTFGWSLPDFTGEKSNLIKAALWSLLAAFSFGCSTVFSKKALTKFSFVSSTFYRYFFATIIAFIIVLFSGHLSDFQLVTQRNWLFIIIIGLTTGSGAIFLYYYGLRNVKAMVSTFIELLNPVTALLLDSLINKTQYSIIQWSAAAIMLFAIIKLNLNEQKRTISNS